MSGNCGTCRHWLANTERTGYGEALSIRRDYGSNDYESARHANEAVDILFGECEAIVLNDDLPPDVPIPLATVRDGSDYRATLYTQAEFGCAMHETTEETP